MQILSHILGFPRIGLHRELKKSLESYWAGQIDQTELLKTGQSLREAHWLQQSQAGADFVTVGDFAWYDHVLSTSLMLGNVPKRHQNEDHAIDLDTLFRVARGRSVKGTPASASEMTKWFNTNYHYIVPELTEGQHFSLSWMQLFEEVEQAQRLGYRVKPVLIGPITYLWLGKVQGQAFDRLTLLPQLLVVYRQILEKLAQLGVEWVQIDEPALVLDLPVEWQNAYQQAYHAMHGSVKLLLTTYFDRIGSHLDWIALLPVQGLHLDLIAGKDDIRLLNQTLPEHWVLSLGVINGRNVWRTDLQAWYTCLVEFVGAQRQIWLGTSCSLLHCPIDLSLETDLRQEVRNWFAFAVQKCYELVALVKALNDPKPEHLAYLEEYSQPIQDRAYSTKVHDPVVTQRLASITQADLTRGQPYMERADRQRQRFQLPLLPTTTIGSFPQTAEIRRLRLALKRDEIDFENYQQHIRQHIAQVIATQEALDIDVLVHGEAERNDMVEYFGELLSGFAFTKNGWVQSYGSRCVKPPIIIGDIYRSKPMTLDWLTYAQSLTKRPVKGMLTGPVTILCWSFPREDVSRELIAKQIALALRDEVVDLEKAGIGIIQIDEPALKEGLPLKKEDEPAYFKWAIEAFRLASCAAKSETQIHTHMCYSEFNDMMSEVAALDADVITIETSRSNMELLDSFKHFAYPNEVGLGVYDIHSPNIPSVEWMENLLTKAAQWVPVNRLWVNPDCGLKTRSENEAYQALSNMVQAAKNLREKIAQQEVVTQ